MSNISNSSFHQKINDSSLWINGTWEQITALHPAPYEMFKYALTWPDLSIATFPICFLVIEKGEGRDWQPCRMCLSNTTVKHHTNSSEIVSVLLKLTSYLYKDRSFRKKKKKKKEKKKIECLYFMRLTLILILLLLCPTIFFLNIFLWDTAASILLISLHQQVFHWIQCIKTHLTPPPKGKKGD